jgi:hypothetical protein
MAAALALGVSSSAHAELADDVEALRRAWSPLGPVRVMQPHLITQGQLLPLLLPPDAAATESEGCTTVSVLGAMSTAFIVRFLPAEDDSADEGESAETSVGGAVQLVRCGRRRASLERLVVEMRSPRAIVQAVYGRSRKTLPSLRQLLRHRDPGVVAASMMPGPRPTTASIDERALAVRRRAEQEGAAHFEQRMVPSGEEGIARVLLGLEPGCHRISVLGITPTSPQIGLDMDAEVRWADTGEVATQDRSDSPDATLGLCVGAAQNALLTFAGGIPGMPTLITHARWELPAGLPIRWSPEARASMADVLWRTGVRGITTSPIYESLGVAGTTTLPLEVEPGACYVVAAAPVRADVKLIAMAVEAGPVRAYSHSDEEGGATLLAFCVQAERRARLDVEAHGASVVWLGAVWQTGRVPLGEGVE